MLSKIKFDFCCCYRQLVAGFILISFSSFAQIPSVKVLTEVLPPYAEFTAKGQLVGTAVVAVESMLVDAELEFATDVYPWARSYNLAKSQPNTLIYSIFRNEEREAYFHWFCPLLPKQSIFLFRLAERTDIDVKTVEDLKKYKIGAVRGDAIAKLLQTMGFNKGEHLDLSSDGGVNLKTLYRGRIDLMAGNWSSTLTRVKQIGKPISSVKTAFDLTPNQEFIPCMALNKKSDPRIVKRIQNAFEKYKARNIQ